MTMRPITWFRIAAVLTLLFAVAHTYGFLALKAPTPQSAAVREAMASVSFLVRGHRYSFGGFYMGFGLFVSAALILLAVLTWWLGSLAITAPAVVVVPGVALALFQVASLVLAVRYFGAPPAVFSAVTALVLFTGAWRARSVGNSR